MMGIPLVGMHNACGLPVVTSWPQNDEFQALTISGTLKPLFKNRSCHPRTRRKTFPKRRAPQPDSKLVSEMAKVTEVDARTKRTMRVAKKPSFKVARTGTFPAKVFRSRVVGGEFFEIRKTGSLKRKSSVRRSDKRRTLYAKDDGEEAVEVLTNLCLNPLARSSKRGSFMMW